MQTMMSDQELVNALRAAPAPWMDAAIVVAFNNRFEFVGEDPSGSRYTAEVSPGGGRSRYWIGVNRV